MIHLSNQYAVLAKLCFSSERAHERFLNYFPAKELIVTVVSATENEHRLVLECNKPGEHELVTGQSSLPMQPVVSGNDHMKVTNEQNRNTNMDVTELTERSPQPQLHVSSFKPTNLQESNPPHLPSSETNDLYYQQGQENHTDNLSNITASQTSKVPTTPSGSQSYSEQKSASVLLDKAVTGEGEPDMNSTMTVMTYSPTKLQSRRKEHTIFCFLHHSEGNCISYETPEDCQHNYDKVFATGLEKFLSTDPKAHLASANNEDSSDDEDYLKYVESHLQSRKCPSFCSTLWKYCVDNKVYYLLKHAPEGLMIHSNEKQNLLGTLFKAYSGYRNMELIGSGGFGNVYQYNTGSGPQLAIKEEFKHPLVTGSIELFQQIMLLHHPHVIKVIDYLVGPKVTAKPKDRDGNGKERKGKDGNENNDQNKNGKAMDGKESTEKDASDTNSYLFVMPFMNRKGLHKQFTQEGSSLKCVLDYMTQYPNQEKFIFRNFTLLFKHTFEGLCYLKSKGIVHRDIKTSNILVHQTCTCGDSPLQCTCDGGVTYLLGDMDLLCLEKESSHEGYTYDEWKKMDGHDPAGTIGMRPPESFFRDDQGKHVTSHLSDVWSICVTMMNVLIGKGANSDTLEQISNFISVVTKPSKSAAKSINESSTLLDSIIRQFSEVVNQIRKQQGTTHLVNNLIPDIRSSFSHLEKLLAGGEASFKRSQSFQLGYPEIYEEESPLAGILTTVYGAQVLHWKCLTRLPHIYGTQLWSVMQQTLNVIVKGIKFVPGNRQDASTLLHLLREVEAVDCTT